jgi:hypothetical protein
LVLSVLLALAPALQLRYPDLVPHQPVFDV